MSLKVLLMSSSVLKDIEGCCVASFILFIIVLIVSSRFGTTFYTTKQAMTYIASFDNDKIENKLESIIGNKNMRAAVLARN
jgi:hypothetical protein